jgi:hypothetical protein
MALGLLNHPEQPSLMVCPAKVSDLEQWRRWHRLSGGTHRFVVFGPGEAFNFLAYNLTAEGGVEALLPMLENLADLLTRNKPQSQDGYFRPQGVQQALQAIRAVHLATGTVSIQDVWQFLISAPATDEELDDGERYAVQTLRKLGEVPGGEADYCLDYWNVERIQLGKSEKTLASIHSVALQLVRPFLTGPVGQCMSGNLSTVTPETLEQPTVLFLNFPVLSGHESARLALATWVMSVNRYIQRRGDGRAIVQISDEHPQTVIRGEDAKMAATGRSAKAGRILVAQNIPQYAAQLGGGQDGQQEALSLIACMATVVLHANPCKETNAHFSAVVGEEPVTVTGGGVDAGEGYDLVGDLLGTWQPRVNINFHTQYRPAIPPQLFLQLKTGGKANAFTAEAIVLASNRQFRDGRSWCRVSIPQVL